MSNPDTQRNYPLTPGQLLSAKERAAQAFREQLGREGVSIAGSRIADHVTGFKRGWDACVAFLGGQSPQMSDINVVRTGQKVAFLDVGIGCAFFAHGRFFIRTDFDAGTVLSGSQYRCAESFNFVIDGKTTPANGPYSHAGETCEEVEAVDVTGNDRS